jgi:hypothetical protein
MCVRSVGRLAGISAWVATSVLGAFMAWSYGNGLARSVWQAKSIANDREECICKEHV